MQVSAGEKQLKKGDYLFKEGDASDAAYLVKLGQINIVKTKGTSELVLTTLNKGQMFGEMAFFDQKPRSASARASQDTVVISLPFISLNAQFQTFPQWLKLMVRTINENLRKANLRIKNLEMAQKGDEKQFPPHMITRLGAIITLVCRQYAKTNESGHHVINFQKIRDYTIQIFQTPTNRMLKFIEIMQGMQLLKLEDLGEGRQQLVLFQHQLLADFVDYYNKWLFTEESKRVTVEAKDIKLLKTLQHYGEQAGADDKGKAKVNLTQIQNDSMKDLGYLVSIGDWHGLIERGIISEMISEATSVSTLFELAEIQKLYSFWNIVYTIETNDPGVNG
ncbi:MAG: hypothetical protein COT74_12510 [Bdellovibrionales bacterium CG10_big_fil_rev_8_21_14_0_10_45_34]|nr:MAG: hypothetical protein COT74_12510 [Bdellovibrionales bacterium CG10_big_fil_rev_8_21_14_0_10_45_34]